MNHSPPTTTNSQMSAHSRFLLPAIFLFVSLGLQDLLLVKGLPCLIAPNSTSPSGYYLFNLTWFPTPNPATYLGELDGEDFPGSCEAKCNSTYGFYIKPTYQVLLVPKLCYCLNGEPDYTQPIQLFQSQINGYYAKKCPIVKGPPPPLVKQGPPPPSPKPPPPPYTPKNCRVPYNSSEPYGFYYFTYGVFLNRFGYIVSVENGSDVWPYQGSNYRCANHCKAYKWGFLILTGKYENEATCACLTKPMTYEIGPSVTAYFIVYYSKSCPSKIGGHPPGVGGHSPTKGRHPPGKGGHPPGKGSHPPGVGGHAPVGRPSPMMQPTFPPYTIQPPAKPKGKHPPGVGHHPPRIGNRQ